MKYLTLLILLFVLVMPAFAQDVPTAESTVEAMPVVIVGGEGSATVDNSPLGILLTVGVFFVGLVTALSLGLQVAGNRAQTAANNPLEIAVLEKAYESISPAILSTIIDPLKAALERSDKALQSVLDLLNKAGDKVPEASKSRLAPYPSTTGTPMDTTYTSTATTDVGEKPGGANTAFPGG
jgi:hypothetical protein